MITRWIIRRRDRAAERWLATTTPKAEVRARRTLVRWDSLLKVWVQR